ncbi:hypothetical protein [Klebsiella pneumoniae]|uniref:hypothetical protein n=1 Tax=Klebsiella pneumoniae TaxID=573 RepID=UPI0020CC57DE|nr:hypothetical protein [Klebsiella pneumoniae]MCQ0584973.1 hypothetical protein [Klebsiella pneumoniae]
MTKSTITREQLIKKAQEQIEFCRHTKITGEGRAHVNQCAALFEIALAAMNGEPVAWTWHYREQWHVTNDERRAEFVAKDGDVAVLPLYHHAQQAPEYPEVLPCPVLLEPGLRFGKGIKTSIMLSALARRAVHESDMAALSPEERAEFQTGIEDFKALIAQPVPVVPQDVLEALQKVARIRLDLNDFDGDRRGIADCLGDAEEALIEVVNRRAAMLAAAPQPQNAQQNIPEIIPDCWCRTCRPVVLNDMRFVVCPDCGNKRCPRANDHRNACTGSNEPGQEGSAYPDTPQEVKGE